LTKQKALLKEDTYFDTAVVEARREIDRLERLSRQLAVDERSGRLKQGDELSEVLRKLRKVLKEAKEYSGGEGSENSAEYLALERAAVEAMEEAEDRKSICEAKFAARMQLEQEA
jgi:molybdenum-dependent DNA-binding transcriptional regulator ModE